MLSIQWPGGQRSVSHVQSLPRWEPRWHLHLAAALLVAVGLQHSSAHCSPKHDANGNWTGDTTVGGTYTLTCNSGFAIIVGQGNRTVDMRQRSISCPSHGEGWDEDPVCINWDSCASLKHDCGKFGVCVDDVRGYHCDCEEGVQLFPTNDGSGEFVCGNLHACEELDCGSHGVCVEFEGFGNRKTSSRCSCARGYHNDGKTCVPNDCGPLHDAHGDWQGNPRVGGNYILSCHVRSFITSGVSVVRSMTITCPAEGKWPSDVPRCINAFSDSAKAEFRTFRWWFAVICASICIISAAVAAGLTMGLVSLSEFELQLLMFMRCEECSTTQEADQLKVDQQLASQVHPLLQDRHRLLVTLLLLNAVANEALPIFLDQVMPAYIAVIFSVTCVLFLGEIFPSAVFTGPSQLSIAAVFAPLVNFLQTCFCPLALPIKLLLDLLVGHSSDGPKYSRAQLRALFRLHEKGALPDDEFLQNGESDDNLSGAEMRDFTSSTERLLRLEGSRSPDNLAIPRKADGGLRHLECALAQQSVQLSRLQLRSLSLDLQPVFGKAPHGSNTVPISSTTTVLDALNRTLDGQPGQLILVLGPDCKPMGTITREALLWTALMPTGI